VVPWLVSLVIACTSLLLAVTFGSRMAIPASERCRNGVSLLAWSWLVAGLVSSVIGLLQYYAAADTFWPWLSRANAGEAYANLRQRNQFATLTSIALAALLWLGVGAGAGGRRAWWLMSAALLLVVGNAASSSRTGFVQLLLLCCVQLAWSRHDGATRRILTVALSGYVAATLLLPWFAGMDPSLHGLISRLRAGDEACTSRIALWSNVLELIALKPWTGWGWGELDYAHYTTVFDGLRFCQILDNAHNLPLHLAVELGLPFALLACGGLLWWICRNRPWCESDTGRQLAWSVLAVIGLHSLLEYPLWYGPFQIAAAGAVAILWRHGAATAVGPRARAGLAGLAATGLVLCGYALWDYHRVSQIYLPSENRSPAYRTDTLAKIQGSWIFANQVAFAELTISPLTSANAQWTYDTAKHLLHYSPEPQVIEKVIESATMLGWEDDAVEHLARYRAAFPDDYARWTALNSFRFPAIRSGYPNQ
jgi:hypothetical protein